MRFAGQIAGSFLLIRVKRRHLFIVSALCVSMGKLPSPFGNQACFECETTFCLSQVSSSWAPPPIWSQTPTKTMSESWATSPWSQSAWSPSPTTSASGRFRGRTQVHTLAGYSTRSSVIINLTQAHVQGGPNGFCSGNWSVQFFLIEFIVKRERAPLNCIQYFN